MRVVDRLSQPLLAAVAAVVAAAVAAVVVVVAAAAEVYCINFVEHRYYVALALVRDTVSAAYECLVDPL